MQVQNEGGDYKHSDGRHGGEVLSEDNNATATPLPVHRRVIPLVVLCTLTFYTIIYFCRTLSNCFVVSRWNSNCPC